MAMDEKIKNLARKYGGRRAFFQTVDAESIGQQAVLDALYTDKGLAWFAGHCYERVEAAIRRASAQKPFVPKSKRGGDGTGSLDNEIGDGGTLRDLVGQEAPIIGRETCGDWVVIDKKTSVQKFAPRDTPGSKFIPTCKRDVDGVYKNTDGQVCDRCGGSGRIVVSGCKGERPLVPDLIAADAEAAAQRTRALNRIYAKLFEGLTPKQIEIIQLRYGIGQPDPMEPKQIVEYIQSKSFINKLFSFVGEFELISRIRDRSFSFIFMKEKTDKVKNLLPSNRWETTYIF
jgi:hypothetical protein